MRPPGAGAVVLVVVALLMLGGCTTSAGVGSPIAVPTSSQTTRNQTSGKQTSGKHTSTPPAQPSPGLAARKAAAGIADCPSSQAKAPALADGLPDVVLPCLGGGRSVHLAGLRGTPMLINVWAQWCGPCRQEAPYLAQLGADRSPALMILGIDYADPRPDLALEFARQAGWTYPQLVDADKQLAAPLQIAGPPQTFFVRADGSIAYRHSGAFTSVEQIRGLARQHLGVSR